MPYGPLLFAALVVIVAIGYVTRPGHRSRQMGLDVDRTGARVGSAVSITRANSGVDGNSIGRESVGDICG